MSPIKFQVAITRRPGRFCTWGPRRWTYFHLPFDFLPR